MCLRRSPAGEACDGAAATDLSIIPGLTRASQGVWSVECLVFGVYGVVCLMNLAALVVCGARLSVPAGTGDRTGYWSGIECEARNIPCQTCPAIGRGGAQVDAGSR